MMKPHSRALLAVFIAVSGAAVAETSLGLYHLRQESLAPGLSLPAQLQDKDGKAVSLPTKGRSLMWVESNEGLKHPPRSDQTVIGAQLKRSTDLGRTFVLFYARQAVPILPRAARPEIVRRYPGAQVMFDERGVLRVAGDHSNSFMTGLYFLNGRQVVCRFMSVTNQTWLLHGINDHIMAAARAFMLSGSVASCPQATLTTGARINTSALPGAGKVRVLLRIYGDEADAPPNSVTVTTKAEPGGIFSEVTRKQHPGSARRFILDSITPIILEAGAVPIAVVTKKDADLAKLKKVWPQWTFLPATSANQLRWLELQGAVVSPDNLIRFSFGAHATGFEKSIDQFRNALRP